MLPTPGPGERRFMLAPASARSLCIPQQGFHNPAPPREDALSPALRGLASLSQAAFLQDPGLTRPRPLAVPQRAGRTTFFWLDFCPCSSVPGGPSEGLGHRTWELQRASGVCVPHSGTSEPSQPSSYLATGSLPSSVSSLGPSMPIQVRGPVTLDLCQNHLAAY